MRKIVISNTSAWIPKRFWEYRVVEESFYRYSYLTGFFPDESLSYEEREIFLNKAILNKEYYYNEVKELIK